MLHFLTLSDSLNQVIVSVQETLQVKQAEYNMLLEAKDAELDLLTQQVMQLNETVEQVKRDRIKDQRILHDFETENNFLSVRLQEITNGTGSPEVIVASRSEGGNGNGNGSGYRTDVRLEVTVKSHIIFT